MKNGRIVLPVAALIVLAIMFLCMFRLYHRLGTVAPDRDDPQGQPMLIGALQGSGVAADAADRQDHPDATLSDDARLPPRIPRYADAEVIEQTATLPDHDGLYRKDKLVKNPGSKFPVLRIEETWQTSADSDVLVREVIMAGDQVMVQIAPTYTLASLESVLQEYNYNVIDHGGIPNAILIRVQDPVLTSVPDMIQTLQARDEIAIVEPNFIYHHTASDVTWPDDPMLHEKWTLEHIGLPYVWNTVTGTGGVVVAVFDTGVQRNHPDLEDNLWVNPLETLNGLDDDENSYVDDIQGWDFYDRNNDPSDITGHGTHVAGTLGAVGNNSFGISGVLWDVNILPIKFFGLNSFGWLEGSAWDAAYGMYYVISHASRGVPIRLTNHSWGGSGYSSMLFDAFALAEQYGILHVAAAGNRRSSDDILDNDIEPYYPSSFALSNMLAVASTSSNDTLLAGSFYGAQSVHLGAPGQNVLSTFLGGTFSLKTGTSMATPMVTGVAALLFELFPEYDWQTVRQLILEGTVPLDSLQGRTTSGGRLDAKETFSLMTPHIQYTPEQTTTTSYVDFPVTVHIRPGNTFAKHPAVLWNTTGSLQSFYTNELIHIGDNVYSTVLPGQPNGTQVSYYIRAESPHGETGVHPADAPVALHRLDITEPVSLQIFGYPQTIGTVSPDYGAHQFSWGTMMTATASPFVEKSEGRRWRSAGWNGTASVPPAGASHEVAFELRQNSYLLWLWKEQARLTQVSDPPGVFHEETWADVTDVVSTLTAPSKVMINGQDYAFIGWEIDGSRYPDDVNPAVNPASHLSAADPSTAVARYVPVSQDSDGDGLPDWWEWFYFNHLDYGGDDDPDGDGFTNAEEYAAGSDPTNAESIPEGPGVDHDPSIVFTGQAAPWWVDATVTDRVGVAEVSLHWSRNEALPEQVAMTAETNDLYRATIPGPYELGDVFHYHITAEGVAGYVTETETFAFTVEYPLMEVTPTPMVLTVTAGEVGSLPMSIINTGNADLVWQTTSRYYEPVSATPGGWTHGGVNDQWHISTRESAVAPYAWFCGDPDGGLYNHMMDASLVSPPVTLGAHAALRFQHWPEMEYDGRLGFEDHYWDGAVVELSTDGGMTFEAIEPIGGYPYLITPNPASPFEPDRPCFGGITGGWHVAEFNLDAYAGETVQVRFRFGTDEYFAARGWFVDDIEFTWETPWLQTPSDGVISAGNMEALLLQVDASTLAPGVHRGVWALTANAPHQPLLAMPLTVHVLHRQPTVAMQFSDEEPDTFVLSWDSYSGHVYHVMQNTDLLKEESWNAIPGFTNLSGTGTTMTYTGQVEAVPFRFYRVLQQEP